MSHRREYDRAYHKAWREANPEKMAEYNRTQMERRRARRVVRQGVCARCGKTFEVGIGKRMTKYCSHTCMKREMTLRQMAKERAKREAREVRELVCPICGTAFTTQNSRQKYCSERCKKASQMRSWRARQPKDNGGEALLPRRNEEVSSSSRRDKSVASPLLKACVVCGKVFKASRCTALTCSRKSSNKHYRATHPVVKPPKAERPKVERRDSFGLTREQRMAVITAQDGDRDALWAASQTWTPAQRKFAKARWESLHPIHKDFSWVRY